MPSLRHTSVDSELSAQFDVGDMGFADTEPSTRMACIDSRVALRVLVVDDDPVNQLLVTAQLLMLNIVPMTASDGLEAVVLTMKHDFDVILMDINMPVMDGIAAAVVIRDHQLENPARARSEVVAYTASGLTEEALLSQAGIRRILRKPCNADDVQRCISQCRSARDSSRHTPLEA